MRRRFATEINVRRSIPTYAKHVRDRSLLGASLLTTGREQEHREAHGEDHAHQHILRPRPADASPPSSQHRATRHALRTPHHFEPPGCTPPCTCLLNGSGLSAARGEFERFAERPVVQRRVRPSGRRNAHPREGLDSGACGWHFAAALAPRSHAPLCSNERVAPHPGASSKHSLGLERPDSRARRFPFGGGYAWRAALSRRDRTHGAAGKPCWAEARSKARGEFVTDRRNAEAHSLARRQIRGPHSRRRRRVRGRGTENPERPTTLGQHCRGLAQLASRTVDRSATS